MEGIDLSETVVYRGFRMESKWHYLGWKRPFSIEFADHLKKEYGKSRSYDHLLIWTPSARAGRHVLNELFGPKESVAEAFHPPRLVTPARFVRSLLPDDGSIATETQCLYAWKRVLELADPSGLEAVFPVIPRENKSAWAFTVGQQLMRLRGRLAEDQWDFRKIASQQLPQDLKRWSTLGRLEQAYLEELSSHGLEDPECVLERILTAEISPQPYSVLMVAGVLNMSQRQAACMRALAARGLEIEFYLPIPEEQRDAFDALGRPEKDLWEKEPLPETLIKNCLQRSPEPRELVEQILELSEDYGGEVDSLVVGSPERDLADYLIERSRLTKTPYYAPEGRALAETSWGRLIGLINDWQKSGQLATLFNLLNHDLFREWAVHQGLDILRLQGAIQSILKEQLLKTSRQLLDNGLGPSKSIGLVREGIELLDAQGFNQRGRGGFAENLWKLLRQVAISQQLAPESLNSLRQIEELLQDIQAGFENARLTESDWWELLNFQLTNTQFYPERSEDERPVSGWLELPWECAPHIVLLSLPDSQVPGPKVLDSFLTPLLCRSLGLYGPDELAAFHAFRLRLILESRKQWGRVDILLPDRGLDDSPVLPTRFLFLADETCILNRVETLLGERSLEEDPLPAEFGTRLQPPPMPEFEKISVTALRTYLNNPFHFYLERLNYLSPPEALPREVDAMAFGQLAHTVLEGLNSREDGISLLKEKEIVEFLLTGLDEQVLSRYGSRIPVSLQIQVSSLAERFRAAAGHIARERQSGWIPEKAEWVFHKDLDFRIGGIRLRGVVDLLEKNEESGQYRIVDYKTSDKAADPARKHLTHPNARSREPLLPECDFLDGKKTARWTDLQLPLYQKAVELLTGEIATCAYFNLSKAVGEIGILEWATTEAQREAALQCAEAIVKQIQTERFPLEGNSSYEDPWLKWFGGDYERNLHPDWVAKQGGKDS
ncbi:hypothetical protein G0Q06_05070 [Puniceicoccales bacterium CK1056]|uniref:PD-(D/E)XK endonuclease-like domain-containing protein n=1 Tax=Oceanipulchritudo coccoides TaxID=2706888 RepID=A0A6B2M1Z6_9BACT|nr:hypothetical protein [Oceanipulchritudo coccoides]